MKVNRGYTLIELIATIIIIGVILGLVVVSTSKIINTNTQKTMSVVAKEILAAVEYEVIENNIDPLSLNENSVSYILNESLGLNYSPKNYRSITFYCDKCESDTMECPSLENFCTTYGVVIVGKGDWNNRSIRGTKDNLSFD